MKEWHCSLGLEQLTGTQPESHLQGLVVDTGERGPHMLTILARIQLLNACIASNQAGRALLRMETEILRRRHEYMT